MMLLGRWNWWPGRLPGGDRAEQDRPELQLVDA